ncbi:MAG: ABC transporter permease [Alloacidobacterium sp.]|jgi:predicted permease
MSWWRRLFSASRMDSELDSELRHHLDLMVAANIRSGGTEEEARRSARLEFGGLEQVKEDCRESRGTMLVASMLQDLRFAVRQICKNPGFVTVTTLTLALGIGATTAIFTVINAALLRPLPYANPAELVTWHHNESLPDVDDIRAEASSLFSAGGAVNPEPMDYTSGIEPLGVHAGFVDAGLFQVLGVPAMLGRTLSSAEDRKGGPRLVVLANRFWQEHLGSDPNIVGKTITLSGNSYTVIGVMPKSFAVPEFNLDVFVSLWVAYPEAAAYRGVHFMRSYWRLKPGVTLDQARAGMVVIDTRLEENYSGEEKGRRTLPVPLQELVTGNVRPALRVLFGAVFVVLLIACANFAGLLMARSVTRRREMVVRAALGADRRRLIRQALTESFVLAILGGVTGLVFAKLATNLLVAVKPAALAHLSGISMDSRVLSFGLVVSTVTGLIFGLVPAWNASVADVAEALKQAGRTATVSMTALGFRKILVVGQLSLAMILLVGAGLLVKSFARLYCVDPGFNPEHVTSIPIQMPAKRYDEVAKQTQFRRELLARLNSLPGVEAAMVGDVPFNGNQVTHGIVVEGQQPKPVGDEPEVDTFCVMGDYFRVMQIPLRAGRALTDTDREDHTLVAVVNQALVRELFAGQNPIGQRIRWAHDTDLSRWMTIVGVVGDVKQSSLAEPAYPAVFTPFSQSDEAWRRWMSVVVRAPDSSAILLPTIKPQIWSLDNRIPLDRIESMDEMLNLSLRERRFNMALLVLFATIATVLAAVGIYSVMAYTVSQRTHEIGIRVAVGARRSHLLKLVLGQGACLAVIGLAAGIGGAFALTRLMASLLFEVTPTDPVTIATVTLLMMVLALLACYIPARHATRVDPMVALRYE